MSRKNKRYFELLSLVVVVVFLLGLSVWNTQRQLQAVYPRVAIVNPLCNVFSEMNFTEKCTKLFENYGYKVDVYVGEQVTVDFLKKIPRKYSILVFRVHSGVFDEGVWFFTGEEFDGSKYVLDQLSGEVHIARCPSDPRLLFSVGERFVRHYMGGIDGCLVVFMGCDSLVDTGLAEGFLDCGACGFVGWDGGVMLDRSDVEVLEFLGLYLESGSVEDSLSGEEGRVYNSSLCFFCGS